jgi:DNA-3-methyladenine glycosylase
MRVSQRATAESLSIRVRPVHRYFCVFMKLRTMAAFIGQTERNRVLFGPPGVAYVYLVYGSYYCLNVSCLPAGEPGGVLFRAIEPLEGVKTMARLRDVPEAFGRISNQ